MSEPTLPEPDEAGPPERLHPLFLLSGLGRALRGIAGGYVAVGYLAVSGRWETALLVTLGLLALVGIGVFLHWTRFSFRVSSSDIRIDSGIVSRRHRSIPFDRIQDVDITQGPLARVLGLAAVKFETGGGAGTNPDDAVIDAITLGRAHEIRDLVRAGRRTAPVADPTTTREDQPPVYRMSVRRLLLSGIFNFSLAVFAALFGLSQSAGDLLGFDPLNRRFWMRVAEGSDPLTGFILDHRAGAAIAGTLLLLIVGAATGIVRTFARDFGFRIDRTEAGLRRRRGLLTRTDVTLPARRAQAAVIATGPVRDAFGWSELRLQSLAQDEGGSGDHVLAPLATEAEIAALLGELDWRPAGARDGWRRLSPAYVTAFALGWAPVAAFAGAGIAAAALIEPAAEALPGVAVLAAIVAAIATASIFIRWLAWRRSAYALDGDRLLIRSGWWRRRLTLLPLAKIQSIDLTENWLSRWFGIAALQCGVAGGGAGGHLIPAIPSAAARALRDQLLEGAS